LLEAEELYDYAVRLLAATARSAGDMREKLRRRAAQAGDVEAVLSRLRENGYLDDERFAGNYAAARLENSRFGSRRVLRDLRARRVSSGTAGRAVAKAYADVDQEALAEEFVRRKYRGRSEPITTEREFAAAWRILLRAGFAPDVSMRVLKRMARDPEWLDRLEPPEE
jgi:regulatory protein